MTIDWRMSQRPFLPAPWTLATQLHMWNSLAVARLALLVMPAALPCHELAGARAPLAVGAVGHPTGHGVVLIAAALRPLEAPRARGTDRLASCARGAIADELLLRPRILRGAAVAVEGESRRRPTSQYLMNVIQVTRN